MKNTVKCFLYVWRHSDNLVVHNMYYIVILYVHNREKAFHTVKKKMDKSKKHRKGSSSFSFCPARIKFTAITTCPNFDPAKSSDVASIPRNTNKRWSESRRKDQLGKGKSQITGTGSCREISTTSKVATMLNDHGLLKIRIFQSREHYHVRTEFMPVQV